MSIIKPTPILPIPDLVFYPSTVMPLVVNDSLHRRIIEETIQRRRFLGITLATPTKNRYGEIHFRPERICTVGTPIILEQKGNLIRLVIKGLTRVCLKTVVQNLPYPMYEAEIYTDVDESKKLPLKEYIRLRELLYDWIHRNLFDPEERDGFIKSLNHKNQVLDYLSMFIVENVRIKQILLECQSLTERIYLLNALFDSTQNSFYQNPLNAIQIMKFEENNTDQKIVQ